MVSELKCTFRRGSYTQADTEEVERADRGEVRTESRHDFHAGRSAQGLLRIQGTASASLPRAEEIPIPKLREDHRDGDIQENQTPNAQALKEIENKSVVRIIHIKSGHLQTQLQSLGDRGQT